MDPTDTFLQTFKTSTVNNFSRTAENSPKKVFCIENAREKIISLTTKKRPKSNICGDLKRINSMHENFVRNNCQTPQKFSIFLKINFVKSKYI